MLELWFVVVMQFAFEKNIALKIQMDGEVGGVGIGFRNQTGI